MEVYLCLSSAEFTSLMIVNDFHILGRPLSPTKTDPPLIFDPNAVLAFSIARQGFQAISRNGGDIFQGLSTV